MIPGSPYCLACVEKTGEPGDEANYSVLLIRVHAKYICMYVYIVCLVRSAVVDPLPFLIKINEYKLAVGTLPGDSDTPWVDKHKPRTAVSVDSHSLVVYTELEIISGHVLDSFSINTHVR